MKTALALLTLCALALAGCGSGNASDVSEEEMRERAMGRQPTQEEYEAAMGDPEASMRRNLEENVPGAAGGN